MSPITIHTLNARDNIALELARDTFRLTPRHMLAEIQAAVAQTAALLKSKGVQYSELKPALVPQADRRELALVFDTMQIPDPSYGYVVHDHILPLFTKESSHSVLDGDLCGENSDQEVLRHELMTQVVGANRFTYRHSGQFYLVYVNNLTDAMVETFHEALRSYLPYVGYLDLTYESFLKTYVSTILPAAYIVHRRIVISEHEDDVENSENINIRGLPFEKHWFTVRSLQGMLFGIFLDYKIERPVLPGLEVDTEISINAISDRPARLVGFDVRLDAAKLGYLLAQKSGSLKRLGLLTTSADDIAELIRARLQSNYLYSLVSDTEHNTWRFNVLIEVQARASATRHRVTVALEYLPEDSTVRVITLY